MGRLMGPGRQGLNVLIRICAGFSGFARFYRGAEGASTVILGYFPGHPVVQLNAMGS